MMSSERCATNSGMGEGDCTAFSSTPLRPLAQTPGGFSAATRYAVVSGPRTCGSGTGSHCSRIAVKAALSSALLRLLAQQQAREWFAILLSMQRSLTQSHAPAACMRMRQGANTSYTAQVTAAPLCVLNLLLDPGRALQTDHYHLPAGP